jgi:diguanylate cyclase (GGDEF)-like protein
MAVATFAGGSLLAVDHLIHSEAHILLGFFVIVSALTWTGLTAEAVVFANLLVGFRAVLAATASDPKPPSFIMLSILSSAVLLALGILLTRSFRDLILQMDEAARRDPLTGLLNTRAFQELAERERARAARTGEPISVAFVDLDHFKQINDGHGHVVGDAVLTAFGEAIVTSVRSVDVVGRVGGDEFAIVLPDTDQFATQAVLQRVRHRIAGRTHIPLVTATVGYVTFTSPPDSVEEMLHIADDLMYKGKRRSEPGALIGKVVGRANLGEDHIGEARTIDITNGNRSVVNPGPAALGSSV